MFQIIMSNRFLQQLIIKSIRSNINYQHCINIRSVSTMNNVQSKDLRKKTEKFSFVQNNDADADIFGTLTNDVELNIKLDSLPPEVDDIVKYDKDEQHKRLHITEYHKIIRELIKQHKVLIKKISIYYFHINVLT